MMKSVTLRTLLAFATGALSVSLFAGSSSAQTGQLCSDCIPFTFNYNGQTATPVGQLNFTDPTLIVQNGTGSGATFVPGGAFTEIGAFQLGDYDPFLGSQTLGSAVSLPGPVVKGPATAPSFDLYAFNQLSGTTTIAGGTAVINFSPGGTVKLFSDSQSATLNSTGTNIPHPGPSSTQIAAFTLLSGQAVGTFSSTGIAVTSFFFTLEQTSGPANLFTTLTGQNLLGKALEVGSANVLGDQLSFATCSPTQSTEAPAGSTDFECSTPSAQGGLQLTAIPEPASLFIFGAGLLLVGGLVQLRKNKRT